MFFYAADLYLQSYYVVSTLTVYFVYIIMYNSTHRFFPCLNLLATHFVVKLHQLSACTPSSYSDSCATKWQLWLFYYGMWIIMISYMCYFKNMVDHPRSKGIWITEVSFSFQCRMIQFFIGGATQLDPVKAESAMTAF